VADYIGEGGDMKSEESMVFMPVAVFSTSRFEKGAWRHIVAGQHRPLQPILRFFNITSNALSGLKPL
jgi:hypothetical protein